MILILRYMNHKVEIILKIYQVFKLYFFEFF